MESIKDARMIAHLIISAKDCESERARERELY
jgi:hypothetical protein